jgi:hypothetical protein
VVLQVPGNAADVVPCERIPKFVSTVSNRAAP